MVAAALSFALQAWWTSPLLYLGTLPGIASGRFPAVRPPGFPKHEPPSVFLIAIFLAAIIWIMLGIMVMKGCRSHFRKVASVLLAAITLLLAVPNAETVIVDVTDGNWNWVGAVIQLLIAPTILMLASITLLLQSIRPSPLFKGLTVFLLLMAMLAAANPYGMILVHYDFYGLVPQEIVSLLGHIVCPTLLASAVLVLALSVNRGPRTEPPQPHRPPARYDAPLNRAAAPPDAATPATSLSDPNRR